MWEVDEPCDSLTGRKGKKKKKKDNIQQESEAVTFSVRQITPIIDSFKFLLE